MPNDASTSKKPTAMDEIYSPETSKVIKSNGGPVNWPLRQKCEKMDTAELEQLVREANRIIDERKNARAKKLINNVCTALNELKEMGNVSFYLFNPDDTFDVELLSETEFFSEQMFVIK